MNNCDALIGYVNKRQNDTVEVNPPHIVPTLSLRRLWSRLELWVVRLFSHFPTNGVDP